MKIKKAIIAAVAVLALAAPLSAVEIDPLRLELSVPAGQSSESIITVTNWLDYKVKIKVKPDYYRHIFTENTIPPSGSDALPSCQNWIAIEPDEFELNPKASMRLACRIDVPAGAKEEHVASILFDEEGLVTAYEKNPNEPGNIMLELVPRFTIPVYVAIRGKDAVSAEITDMKVAEGPTIGTIKTEITLHNTGGVHLRPSGNLVFMDTKGTIIKTLPIGEHLPIFPGYKEIIPVYYPNLLEAGNYIAVCTINIGGGMLLQKKTSFRITGDYDVK